MRRDRLREWAQEQYEASAKEAAEKRQGKSKVASLEDRKRRIHSEFLTKDPIWDEYVARVEELQEGTLTEIREVELQLTSREYLDVESCAVLRHRIAVLKAMLDARTECIRIPSQALNKA